MDCMTAFQTNLATFFHGSPTGRSMCPFLTCFKPASSRPPAARLDEKTPTDRVTARVTSSVMDEQADEEKSGSLDEPHREGRLRGRIHQVMHAHPVLAVTTKIIVTLVGSLVLLAGIVMIFTPGQGILAIILGLAILATEYDWAERWLRKARDKAAEAKRRAEAMDPKVRRRRVLLAGAVLLAVVGVTAAYLAAYDWPMFAVNGWDWVQSLAAWVPELPGM